MASPAGQREASAAAARHRPRGSLSGAPVGGAAGRVVDQPRSTANVSLAPGSTLLLYTNGLVERRDRRLDDELGELRSAGAALGSRPVDELCDELLARFAAAPDDDVCLLAVRIPTSTRAC